MSDEAELRELHNLAAEREKEEVVDAIRNMAKIWLSEWRAAHTMLIDHGILPSEWREKLEQEYLGRLAVLDSF